MFKIRNPPNRIGLDWIGLRTELVILITQAAAFNPEAELSGSCVFCGKTSSNQRLAHLISGFAKRSTCDLL